MLLDRAAIESLFQVSRRHASRILQRMGAHHIGGAMVISAEDLLLRIEQLQQDKNVQFEQRRRERLEQQLLNARREIRSRRIAIHPLQGLTTIHALPHEIRFEPGELHVRFNTPVELLQRLMVLAEAIADNWEAFERTGKL
jgi:hypothetical protein